MDKDDLHALFIYENGHLIRKVTRNSNALKGTRISTIGSCGYLYVSINYKAHSVHRIVWQMFNGPVPEGYFIDHRNGVRTDNRIENLRLATIEENNRNRGLSSANTSGTPGVFWLKREQRWLARITVDGKRIYLGYHTDANEAIKARKKAEVKYFGEFAPMREGRA